MPASDFDLYNEYTAFGGPQGDFEEWAAIYRNAVGNRFDDPEEDQGMFFEFLNAFTPDVQHHTKDWWLDIREEFYEMAEITEEDIDWDAYREALGYGRD